MKALLENVFKFREQQELEETLSRLPQITLSLPPIRNGKDKGTAPKLPLMQWQSHRGHDHELLTEITSFLAPLNRAPLPLQQRLDIADKARKVACRVINTNYNQYIFADTFPVPENRRQTLAATIELLDQLLISYKHIFREALKMVKDQKSEGLPLLRQSGFRILELINVLQRKQALNYKTLAPHVWGEFNQVFYTLLILVDVTAPQELSGYLTLRKTANGNGIVYSGDKPKSPLHLFMSVQLFGLTDAYSWPPEHLHMNDAYISVCKPASMFKVYDGQNLDDGQAMVYFDQSRAPSLSMHNKRNKPAIIIDVLPLLRLVNTDLNNLLRAPGKVASPALATLNTSDRLPFIQNLQNKLFPRKRVDNRVPVSGQSRTLKVYLGFEESHRPICNLDPARYKRYINKKEFTEMLAANSAMIAEDDEAVLDGRWFLVDESEGGLKIRTRETRFTNNVSLGQIICYQELSADSESRPMIGSVCRVQRTENQDLELAVTRLSGYSEGIVVRRTMAGRSQSPVLAFLAKEANDNWMLILHADFVVEKDEVLSVERGERTLNVRIGNILTTQREFSCYQLLSAGN